MVEVAQEVMVLDLAAAVARALTGCLYLDRR